MMKFGSDMPDPFGHRDGTWVFSHPQFDEALARLAFITDNRRSCGIITGPSGTGKSYALYAFARMLHDAGHRVIQLDLCGLTRDELVWKVAADLGLAPAANASCPQLWVRIEDALHGDQATGGQTVLLCDHVDEAEPALLSALERLLRLNDPYDCGITAIAAMQTASPNDRWIARHAELRIDLAPLDRVSVSGYLRAAVRRMDATRQISWSPAAVEEIYRSSKGNLREINRLGRLACLAALADGRDEIDAALVAAVQPEMPSQQRTSSARSHSPLQPSVSSAIFRETHHVQTQ